MSVSMYISIAAPDTSVVLFDNNLTKLPLHTLHKEEKFSDIWGRYKHLNIKEIILSRFPDELTRKKIQEVVKGRVTVDARYSPQNPQTSYSAL